MSVKASDLIGPRPGEHCIMCGSPILMNDAYTGAKGDYAHVRCAIVYDDPERQSAQFDYEYQRGFKAGYDSAYEHGRVDGIRIGETENEAMLSKMRTLLDKVGVPTQVNTIRYGVGQAGRLAWFLERTGYTIQEIGNPDALTEG